MDFKAAALVKVLVSVALLASNGAASAEVVKGKVRAIAKESKVFTLQSSPESLLFILWDNKTEWKGSINPAGINPDEAVTVDLRQNGDQAVAASVSRIEANIPPGVKALYLDKLEESPKGPDKARTLVFVDTRPTELFDSAHIAGALSAPLSRLEKRAFGILSENKSARLIFYDEGLGGEAAAKGAELAVKAGFTDVSILPEGTAGWVQSGRFLASSTMFLRKSKPVIIDLRNPDVVSQGHIEGAANFPASGLKDKSGYFPTEKRVPIVLYGESDSEATAAAETVRKWGYRKVTIFPGGATAWLNSAEVLKTGPAEELISSPSAGHSGQLAPNDFEKALASPLMVEIVDVRSAVEQETGGFQQSKKIALHDLPKRHGELSREKIQVLFASDPTHAEMAYDFLRSKGYKVNYLNGAVEFGKDGKYTVK
jgi:rhodanese-related sulfurtransferase